MMIYMYTCLLTCVCLTHLWLLENNYLCRYSDNFYFCLSYWHEYLISYERKILTWLLEKRRNLSWDLHRCWRLELESHHLQTSQTYVDCKYLYSFNAKKSNWKLFYSEHLQNNAQCTAYTYIYILHISVKHTQFVCKKIS